MASWFKMQPPSNIFLEIEHKFAAWVRTNNIFKQELKGYFL